MWTYVKTSGHVFTLNLHMIKTCFGYDSDMFWTRVTDGLDLFMTWVGHALGMFQTCFGHVSEMSKHVLNMF